MTQIAEYRWKCDYCENVSPAFSKLKVERPTGWVVINRGYADKERESIYIVNALHFCTKAHHEAWMNNAAELME